MEVDTNAKGEALEDRRIERAITIITEATSLIEQLVRREAAGESVKT